MVDRGKGALEAARGRGTRQDVVVAAPGAAAAVFPVVHFQGAFVVIQVHHHGAAGLVGVVVVCSVCVCVVQWAMGQEAGDELEKEEEAG